MSVKSIHTMNGCSRCGKTFGTRRETERHARRHPVASLPPCGCKPGHCYHQEHPDSVPQRECRSPRIES